MVSFLSPLFLIGVLTAVVPIILHLLKREPEPRVRFPAVKLLKQAPVAYTERRRLREWLLLALRVTALVLLALAFARPFLASAGERGSVGVTIVALDTSCSLSAPGTFDRAKQLARAAIDRTPPGDLVGVLTFSDAPALVARPNADRALARSAVDRAAPGYGATRYAPALSAAVQALDGRRGSIVLVTDLQNSGWDTSTRASVPESARIEIADVGAPGSNVAVTAIRADGDRVVASILNTGEAARSVTAHLTLDSRRAGDVRVAVGPLAAVDVEFPGAIKSPASTAAVSVDDPDGLIADNVRYAVLDSASQRPILVVTRTGDLAREAFYVQQALTAGAASADRYQMTAVSPARLSTLDAPRLSSSAAVMLLSTRGLERRGREALAAYVRAGGGLFIAVGPDIDADIVSDVLGSGVPLRVAMGRNATRDPSMLAPADLRHPVFQAFGANAATLGLVKFRTVPQIDGAGCQTVARFTTGEAALLDCAAGAGRGLVFASDLDNRWNDFPLHATFVPFVHEGVRYLTRERLLPSDVLVGDVPSGVPPTPGIATVPALSGAPGQQARRIAVNVDPRESDPARVSVEEFQSAVTRLKDAGVNEARLDARQREERQRVWSYLMVMAIVVLAVEGMIAARTA